MPIEHIEHWLDKYEGKYAASTCSCRASRRVMGEGCADDPADWCIAVGDIYVVEDRSGHYVTRDEGSTTSRRGRGQRLCAPITNIDGENKIFAICNCNVNVCYALRTSQLFNTPNLSRSAYVAKVEKDKCVACGRCVEVCPAGAAKLGQSSAAKKAGGQVRVSAPGCPMPPSGTQVVAQLPQRQPHRDACVRHRALQRRPARARCRSGLLKLAAPGSL